MFLKLALLLLVTAFQNAECLSSEFSSSTQPVPREWEGGPTSFSTSCSLNDARNETTPLITERTSKYIESLIEEWNSTGLAVAVVQKLPPTVNSSIPTWKIEYGSYGLARTSPSNDNATRTDIVTPDTLFSIASNSKLFLSISVGLLISNQTLAESFQNRTGKKLGWWTKLKDLMPEEWVLEDKDIERGATIQDLLSHRTGLPRHDWSRTGKRKDIREAISSLRYLRSSATFRQVFQYNNLMFETLSYLPTLFFNQTYPAYVQQHLLDPLNMTSTTFSVQRAEGELGDRFAEGHVQHLRDMTQDKKGWLKPIVPYFARPGEETISSGPGGVISSARDLSTWMAMLLNNGRHPYTNDVVVPVEVLDFVSTGLVVVYGAPDFPETSIMVYGAGQWRHSYQGLDLIEHDGSNPGFSSQLARFPGSGQQDALSLHGTDCPRPRNHGLGIVGLSNDGETGGWVLGATKFRIAEDLLGLKEVDWTSRYHTLWDGYLDSLRRNTTSLPEHPKLPSAAFESLGRKKFVHPTYGTLIPCLVPESMTSLRSPTSVFDNPHTNCTNVLALPSSRRVLENSALDRPTYLIQWDRLFTNIQRLTHFDGNLFNVSVAWSNADVRKEEGYSDDGDVLAERGIYDVEWVQPRDDASPAHTSERKEGLSFRGNFWGKDGPHSEAPAEGLGKESAEVWFSSSL
ncbi:beta-lactamase/transpeptidase-like protein [Coprinopsis sp. MPI-PUGE-AT-0042]|nr:beta-lactamase/transpeptidase-like protein [Coprinopsis sp. MPI-PUGE-AT-0042]